MLPSFLQPSGRQLESDPTLPVDAKFIHSNTLGRSIAHCLWWPSKSAEPPSTVVLFIPGNPGLLAFYTNFLSHLYKKSSANLAIFAHGHLGHNPAYGVEPPYRHLAIQVQAAIESLDAVTTEYGDQIKVVLVGHSVGAWIAMKVMKERPHAVSASFFLFPTIMHIVKTPNGRILWWIFRRPFPNIISRLSVLARLIPRAALSLLFPDYPPEQLRVLQSLIHSRQVILSALTMAGDEMKTITALDEVHLAQDKHKLWVYLAEKDNWVGEHRDTILREFSDQQHSVRVIQGCNSIPHAFCISASQNTHFR
ncbi:alpha/beta-hydrolase [Rickenella mellea]|uniref:Alpha/beta-hydrolase n=1 Tax=Rickenella mellea TaxID=50990 RepID=A0A4Y7QMB7_9AGAM|nr:alpha/beta-hydrolase [Rickenella mellea]